MRPLMYRVEKLQFVEQICNAPKPPLCKGRWPSASEVGGIVRHSVPNSPKSNANWLILPRQSLSLPFGQPAPFTQGSLFGRSRASAINCNF